MARAAEVERRADAAGTPSPSAIPLDLIGLLTPYKKHGKLSLRVERVPQQTRLSKGTRNSDGSWSLTRDDLDDLEYLVPEGVEPARVLSVRVVSLTAGNTLAVLEVPVSAEERAAAGLAGGGASDADQDAQVRLLRDELTKLKASVAERDAALADLRRVSSGAAEQLADAREIWQREAQEAVAAAERTWQAAEAQRLRDAEVQWQARAKADAAQRAEADAARGREADLAARGLREKVAALEAVLAERNAAHENLHRESREALAAAEAAWRADESVRLAAAEARWREASAKALADADARSGQAQSVEVGALQQKLVALQAQLAEREAALARAEADAARESPGEIEARGLREKLAALQAVLSERDAALARADQARGALQREAADALSAAEQKWRSDEAARAAAVEARWRDASAKALADAGAASSRTQGAELGELREKVAMLQAALTERDEAIAHAEELEIERRAQAEQELHETLTRAEVIWKADEAVRLAAAEARWRETAAPAPAAGGGAADDELRALRERVSGLQSKLLEREAALVRATKGADEERLRWQRDAQQAISKSEKDWKAKEASRRAAAEAQVRKETAEALALATSRYEAAESALAQLRIRASKIDTRGDQEVAALRSALTARDAELLQARVALEQRAAAEAEAAAPAKYDNKRFMRDVGIAAVIGVAVVVAYPFVDGWMNPPPPPVKVVAPPAPPPVEMERVAVVAAEAKLRAGPSANVSSLGVLAAGTGVTFIEERGEWIKVRVDGKPVREGWIKASQLKDVTERPVDAPPALR